MKAYSYIRFSSKQQAKGDSLRRQLQQAQEYCNHHNLILDTSSFRDLGVSAYKGTNVLEEGGLGSFIAALSQGSIRSGDYLIIESLDRMSRQSVQTALRQFLSILSHGITIVTLLDNRKYDQDSDTTDLIISITIMARAYEESDTKSKRLKASWSNKRDVLQVVSGMSSVSPSVDNKVVKLTSLSPHWLKLSECRTEWQAIEDKEKIVNIIYRQTIDGFGQHKLVQWLNSNGYPAPRGNGWAASSVKKILTDKAVLGHYQPHEFVNNKRVPVGNVITNYYPAVVDEDLYYQVQSLRKQRNLGGGGNKGSKFSNLLQGIAYCATCGSTMHMVNKGSNKSKSGINGSQYLICSKARKSTDDCPYVSYSYLAVERSVIQQVLSKDNYHLLIKERVNGDIVSQELEGKLNSLNHKLVEANERLTGYLSMISDFSNISVRTEYKRQQDSIQELEQGIESIKESLANVDASPLGSMEQLQETFQLISNVTQTELGTFATPDTVTPDELYSLRVKLNGVLSAFCNKVMLSKEYVNQANQFIHCVSTNESIESWSVEVGRGARVRDGWFMAGWAE